MNVAIDKSKLANTEEEYRALVNSDANWIARTPEDVRKLRSSQESPLSKLSDADFEAFFTSLTYGNGGISGGSYRPLMGGLTIKEIFDVFASFGMAMKYALDNQEAKCQNGSCVYEWGSFCSHVTCIPQKKPPN
ncbi:hypothetical protein [Bradyrhizobium zhanjiangense]|uniref:hypothetical protein n=1 Tax=Bradyrhizobium zhanjiangense TaxID=1325107 RepID=UPI001008A6D8|nr:hypothetical protein [Bradyrhizobium zhanjiangense]